MNTKNVARAVLFWGLLAALTPTVLYSLQILELDLDVRLAWNATRLDPGPRCFSVELPEPGVLGVELSTDASGAPGLLVLAADGEANIPSTLERTETVLLRVAHAGEHLICLTAEVRLGRLELIASFVASARPDKERDQEETELEPDP